MYRAVILFTSEGDWEWLFIDGVLIAEGHTLEDGDHLYFLRIAEEFELASSDFITRELLPGDNTYANDHGSLPETFDLLKYGSIHPAT